MSREYRKGNLGLEEITDETRGWSYPNGFVVRTYEGEHLLEVLFISKKDITDLRDLINQVLETPTVKEPKSVYPLYATPDSVSPGYRVEEPVKKPSQRITEILEKDTENMVLPEVQYLKRWLTAITVYLDELNQTKEECIHEDRICSCDKLVGIHCYGCTHGGPVKKPIEELDIERWEDSPFKIMAEQINRLTRKLNEISKK